MDEAIMRDQDYEAIKVKRKKLSKSDQNELMDALIRTVSSGVPAVQLKPRRTIAVVQAILQAHADLLRQTAAELDASTIHRCHAANRLRNIANEIAREK